MCVLTDSLEELFYRTCHSQYLFSRIYLSSLKMFYFLHWYLKNIVTFSDNSKQVEQSIFKIFYQARNKGGGGGGKGRVEGGWVRGGGLPCPFWKSKKVPWFWKKGPNCVHPWAKSSIQNIVLRVSRRKSSKIFPAGPFFLAFLMKGLSKCSNSTKPPLPKKISGCVSVCHTYP